MSEFYKILNDYNAACENLQKQVDELKARVTALETAASATTSETETQ